MKRKSMNPKRTYRFVGPFFIGKRSALAGQARGKSDGRTNYTAADLVKKMLRFLLTKKVT